MHVKVFSTNGTNKEYFTWDTDGLTFVVDNSATSIICYVPKVFTGKLIATKIIPETA